MVARALFWGFLLLAGVAQAEFTVRDDTGHLLTLAGPAHRIVSLSPNITENLFAAGAGNRVVGVVEYSNFPPAAKAIPRVGGYERLDLERIVALKPDLLIAWETGNHSGQVDKLRALGLPVFVTQPNGVADVARQIELLGQLAGTEKPARLAAKQFRQRLAQLQKTYADQTRVRVFYQVWKQPLMTVGGPQIISNVIQLCGGENVFGKLNAMSPVVSTEAVLAEKPDVIVASGMDESRPEWVDDWRQWKSLPAVAHNQLYFVPPDLIQRHTPRLLEGAEQLCGFLAKARAVGR